jgi:hypothetical protein
LCRQSYGKSLVNRAAAQFFSSEWSVKADAVAVFRRTEEAFSAARTAVEALPVQ